MKAGGLMCIAASWLASASAASPWVPASNDARPPCYIVTQTTHALPVIFLSDAERAGLIDTDAAFRRTSPPPDDDDAAVIQDDSPAARIDADQRMVPALEPVGTLVKSPDGLPAHRILSRRSPRGPPRFS